MIKTTIDIPNNNLSEILTNVLTYHTNNENYIVDQTIIEIVRKILSRENHLPAFVLYGSNQISSVELLIETRFPEDIIVRFANRFKIHSRSLQTALFQGLPEKTLFAFFKYAIPLSDQEVICLKNSLHNYSKETRTQLETVIDELASHSLKKLKRTFTPIIPRRVISKSIEDKAQIHALLKKLWLNAKIEPNEEKDLLELILKGCPIPKTLTIASDEWGYEEINVLALLVLNRFSEQAILKIAPMHQIKYELVRFAMECKAPFNIVFEFVLLAVFFRKREAVILKEVAKTYMKSNHLQKKEFSILLKAIDQNTYQAKKECWIETEIPVAV